MVSNITNKDAENALLNAMDNLRDGFKNATVKLVNDDGKNATIAMETMVNKIDQQTGNETTIKSTTNLIGEYKDGNFQITSVTDKNGNVLANSFADIITQNGKPAKNAQEATAIINEAIKNDDMINAIIERQFGKEGSAERADNINQIKKHLEPLPPEAAAKMSERGKTQDVAAPAGDDGDGKEEGGFMKKYGGILLGGAAMLLGGLMGGGLLQIVLAGVVAFMAVKMFNLDEKMDNAINSRGTPGASQAREESQGQGLSRNKGDETPTISPVEQKITSLGEGKAVVVADGKALGLNEKGEQVFGAAGTVLVPNVQDGRKVELLEGKVSADGQSFIISGISAERKDGQMGNLQPIKTPVSIAIDPQTGAIDFNDKALRENKEIIAGIEKSSGITMKEREAAAQEKAAQAAREAEAKAAQEKARADAEAAKKAEADKIAAEKAEAARKEAIRQKEGVSFAVDAPEKGTAKILEKGQTIAGVARDGSLLLNDQKTVTIRETNDKGETTGYLTGELSKDNKTLNVTRYSAARGKADGNGMIYSEDVVLDKPVALTVDNDGLVELNNKGLNSVRAQATRDLDRQSAILDGKTDVKLGDGNNPIMLDKNGVPTKEIENAVAAINVHYNKNTKVATITHAAGGDPEILKDSKTGKTQWTAIEKPVEVPVDRSSGFVVLSLAEQGVGKEVQNIANRAINDTVSKKNAKLALRPEYALVEIKKNNLNNQLEIDFTQTSIDKNTGHPVTTMFSGTMSRHEDRKTEAGTYLGTTETTVTNYARLNITRGRVLDANGNPTGNNILEGTNVTINNVSLGYDGKPAIATMPVKGELVAAVNNRQDNFAKDVTHNEIALMQVGTKVEAGAMGPNL